MRKLQRHQPSKQGAGLICVRHGLVFKLEHLVEISSAVGWVERENEGPRKVVDEGDGAEVSVLGIFQWDLVVGVVVRACSGLHLVLPYFSCFQPMVCGKKVLYHGKRWYVFII